MFFLNPEPATAVTKETKRCQHFPCCFPVLTVFSGKLEKGFKKYMYITCTFLMYSVTLSYALFILFKKNQFCSRSSKGSIGALPVICSLASHSAIQLCGVSFLFQAVIGCGSTKNGNITGVQTHCKSNPRSGPACVLCCYK